MSFVENLIEQVARATGLGDNTRKFVGVLASYIFSRPDGFRGFQKLFQKAGLGGIFQSWESGSPSMRDIEPGQIQNALGARDVNAIAEKAGVSAPLIGGLIAKTLPLLVRSLTAGGNIPSGIPASLAGLTGGNLDWGNNKITHLRGNRKRGSFWRWLLPILALLALAYCGWHMRGKSPPVGTPAAATAPMAATDGTAQSIGAPTFAFQNSGGTVDVSGTLATAAEKFQLLDALKATFGSDKVRARLDVDASVKPVTWLDRFKAMLPGLKADGLKFAFNGDAVKLDTSALPEAERVAVSSLFQEKLPAVKVEGLFDRGVKAIQELKAGYNASDLTKALNLTTVKFETGSANLTRSSQEIIRQAAEAIEGAPAGTRVEVGGHTDSQGDATSNQLLSEQRARAVADALIAEGVPAERLAARGFGSNRPVGDNSTDAGRAANRRIGYEVMR
ncbi:OmpA family protein [Stenotrophomonas oahuensis]|uniref:OmpA family protein n=1 Tax=Stenotrophomonas oahuensis TaxID=3003271 RepID=A0ABY9YP68_9GAMM|nr:OmpA family protein [Stenotrophomonas sp. A5586]WNH52697.1 OmpA family protein [Stenotrophomonas sp. A5586]